MRSSPFLLRNQLSWLGVVGLKRTWDQKLSCCLLLMFMTTQLFQFRIAVADKYCQPSWLFTLTFFRTPAHALAMKAREGFRSLWLLCLSCNRGFGFSTPCLRVLCTSWGRHGLCCLFFQQQWVSSPCRMMVLEYWQWFPLPCLVLKLWDCRVHYSCRFWWERLIVRQLGLLCLRVGNVTICCWRCRWRSVWFISQWR